MADRRGFTIIELLLTVIILGILAGTAVPAVNSIITMQEVRTEARKMASALRQVQQESLTTETVREVNFVSNYQYTANGKNSSLPAGISYTVIPGGTAQVTFSSLGVPSPAATVTIQFSDGAGRIQNVKIYPSGRITVETP